MKKGDLVCFTDNGKRRVGNFVRRENMLIVVKMFVGGVFYVHPNDLIK